MAIYKYQNCYNIFRFINIFFYLINKKYITINAPNLGISIIYKFNDVCEDIFLVQSSWQSDAWNICLPNKKFPSDDLSSPNIKTMNFNNTKLLNSYF